jgi:hypothetical protein
MTRGILGPMTRDITGDRGKDKIIGYEEFYNL